MGPQTKNLKFNDTVNKAQQESAEEPTNKKKGKLKEFFSSTPDFGKTNLFFLSIKRKQN